MNRFTNIAHMLALLMAIPLVFTGCSGGGGGSTGSAGAPPPPSPVVGSTGSSSGSLGVYTNGGTTYTVAPGGSVAANTVKLISLPNSGKMVGAVTTAVTVTPITTSLTTVDGTSVDPVHDVGMAFGYHSSLISIFRLSTAQEITTYDAYTANTMTFSGATGVKISGAIMDPSRQWIILSTADGYDIVDYSTPTAPRRVRLIPSTAVDPANGITMMENFGYDPAIPGGGFPALFAGGSATFGSWKVPIQIVDASTGKKYVPDAATQAVIAAPSDYIDSVAVDTTYHVALLAEEGSSQQHLFDLNRITFDAATGTYTLPANGHLSLNLTNGKTLGHKMTNIAIESNGHYVFAGAGFGGATISIAQLQNPSVGLGFASVITGFSMPTGTDDQGNTVFWSGSLDPHGVGAYMTSSSHPTSPNTSLALWMNNTGDHVAVIDLAGVLAGATAGGAYDPLATTPQDIAYFAIP